MGWSVALLRRVRDWRMLFLTIMLGLMASRQALTLFSSLRGGPSRPSVVWSLSELPGLAVSVMAFLAVFFLGQMIVRRQRSDEALRAGEAALRSSDDRYRELFEAVPILLREMDVSGALEYVRELEARGVRDLEAWFERHPDALLECAGRGRTVRVNRAFFDFHGVSSLEEHERTEGAPTDVHRAAICRQICAFAGGGVATPFDTEVMRGDGERRALTVHVRRLTRNGRVTPRVIYASVDVTERRRHEERQRLLMKELNHRVQNALASVLSLSEQTMRSAASLEEFGATFTGRLVAMARTHEALASARWIGLDLAEIVRLTVGPHLGPPADRLRLRGEPMRLPSETSAPLCLAFHELTTNAAKHGALARAGGTIDVEWRRGAGETLMVEWIESGPGDLEPPTRAGLGTDLIRGFIEQQLHGRAELEFRPEGLRGTFTIPL